jgi:hypothetical protein
MNPFNTFTLCLPKIHSNFIFLSTPKSSKWSLPSRFYNQNCACISHLSHVYYILPYVLHLHVIHFSILYVFLLASGIMYIVIILIKKLGRPLAISNTTCSSWTLILKNFTQKIVTPKLIHMLELFKISTAEECLGMYNVIYICTIYAFNSLSQFTTCLSSHCVVCKQVVFC